jgi:hypothetical protein
MLVQAMMQATSDGGVGDRCFLTFCLRHYAPNWVSSIPQFIVFIDVYATWP